MNEVQAKGRATGSTRTADETQIALFWADGLGTVTPPGHWNQIAMQLAAAQGNSLSANARLFAELNIAEADAGNCRVGRQVRLQRMAADNGDPAGRYDGNSPTSPDAAGRR